MLMKGQAGLLYASNMPWIEEPMNSSTIQKQTE